MIMDGHRHIIDDCQSILADMDSFGIDKTVLVGIGVRDLARVTIDDSWIFRSHFLFRTLGMLKARHMVESPGFQNNLLDAPRNDAVLAAVASHPERFYGFAFINPEADNALAELQNCINRGLCGIKLALVQYPSDLCGRRMIDLCEVARSYRLPIFMHLGLTAATSQADWLIGTFPDVNFIIAHAGVQRFEETLTQAFQHDNVFVDTSSYIASPAKIKTLYRRLGASKLIFGSDRPVMCRALPDALAKIEALPLCDAERSQILGGNLLALLLQASPLSRDTTCAPH